MNFWKLKETRTFLLIWGSQLISLVGSGLTNFGIGAWVFEKTHRATDFAFILLAASVPSIILSPFTGAFVDRIDRRRALLYAEAGSGLGSLGLAVLALSGHIQLWHIYTLVAFSSVFASFTWPAMSSAITMLIPKHHLARANALTQYNEAFSMVVAPVIGGVVIFMGGLASLLVLDVVSFVLSIGLLLQAHVPHIPSEGDHHENTFLQDAAFGFKYTYERKGLLGLMGFFFFYNLVSNMCWVLFTPLLLTLYNPKVTGFIQAFFGIGGLIASVAVSLVGTLRNKAAGVVGMGAALGAVQLFYILPPSHALYIISCLVIALIGTVMYTCSQGIWMTKVPPDLHGRVFSVRRMAAWSATPISFLVAGPLADNVFGPGMRQGGALANSLGHLVGTGPDAGIRVMYFMLGVSAIVVSGLAWLNPALRNVERDLPDHDITSRNLPDGDDGTVTLDVPALVQTESA